MQNFIIIGIIAIFAISGAISTIRHFKGNGGCCGGGSYKPKAKKLSVIKYQKTFKVDGMHCEHCKSRVEEIVNDISGVSGKVSLKSGTLTVSYSESVDDEYIKSKLLRAGYTMKL